MNKEEEGLSESNDGGRIFFISVHVTDLAMMLS